MHPIDLHTGLDQSMSLGFLLTYTLVCVLVSGFAIARSLVARRRARDAQDAIDGAAQLREGGSIVTGFAATEGQVPLSVRLRETGREWRTKKGWRHEWVETGRDVNGEPFIVVTDGGQRVRVEPHKRAILIDGMTIVESTGATRERLAELGDGEEVAVTGTLRREGAEGAGAYRSGPPSWVIEPPAGGVMIVSTLPLADRHRFWARRLLQIALVPIVLAFVVNALAFRSFTQFVLYGRPAIGHVEDMRTSASSHRQVVRHVSVDVDGDTVETTVDAPTLLRLHRGDAVALTIVPGDVLFAHEPGLSWWSLLVSSALALIAWLAVTVRVRRQSLWWEQKRVVTSGTGRL